MLADKFSAKLTQSLREEARCHEIRLLANTKLLNAIRESEVLSKVTDDEMYLTFFHNSTDFTFNLGADPLRKRQILAAFVEATGVNLTKRFYESCGQFLLRGEMEVDFTEDGEACKANHLVWFFGYVPSECRIEREEVTVETHTEFRYRSVCNPPEAGSDEIVPTRPEATR